MAERCFRRGKTELPKLCKQRRKKRDKRSREKKKKRAQTVAETPRAKRRSNRLKKTENEPGEGGASGGLELGKGFRFFFPVGAQRPITTGVRNISFRPASIVWRTKKKKNIVYGASLLKGEKKKSSFRTGHLAYLSCPIVQLLRALLLRFIFRPRSVRSACPGFVQHPTGPGPTEAVDFAISERS